MPSSELRDNFAKLECCFKQQVIQDNKTWESIYLPNPIIPKTKVNYVLIGMEPSLGAWTKKESNGKNRIKMAQNMIDGGFKNFAFSIEDFIVHYSIKHYLCLDKQEYYITDLSKG